MVFRRYFTILHQIAWIPLAWAIAAGAQNSTTAHASPAGGLAPAAVPSEPSQGLLVASRSPFAEYLAKQSAVDEVSQAFQREDFAALERSYTQAVEKGERLPSGVFRASQLIRSVGEAFELPREADDPDREVARRARNKHWAGVEAKALRWLQAFPQSTTAPVFLSEIYVQHGYALRGGGYASRVTAEDMESFRKNVEQAYQVLSACAACSRSNPGWHREMIQVARLQGWQPAERYTNVVKNALADFPYDYEIYFEAALSLTPQWGGSAAAVEAFARSAADATKEREGDAVYARIYWSVARMFRGDPARNGMADWARLRRGFDDMTDRYPVPWNLNTFAKFACQAEDIPTLRRVFGLIGDQDDIVAWNDPDTLERCRVLAR